MSIATVSVIMGRIKSAEPESPLAVFIPPPGFPGSLDAIFASTVHGRKRVFQGVSLVGVFDNTMDPDNIKKKLKMAAW